MVCSPGAKHKLGQNDWVYRELEWWIENRNTAPIIIDSTGEGERWIPNELFKRWPKAQQVVVRPREWENSSEREREKEEKNAVTRIVEGICISERHVHYEDLEREKDRSRQLRRLSISLFLLVIVAAALAVFGWWQLRIATNSREEALVARDSARQAEEQAKSQTELAHRQLSRFLASDAERLIAERPALAGLLAVEAARRGHSAAIEDSLRNVLRSVNGYSLSKHEGGVSSVALSANGQTLVTGGQGQNLLVWDLTQREAKPLVLEDVYEGRSIALSADGKTLVSASDKETAMWDLTQPEPKVRELGDVTTSVALSADGRTLVSGSIVMARGELWVLSQPEVETRVVRYLETSGYGVSSVAVSADGQTVVVQAKEVRVWDLTQREAKPLVLEDVYEGRSIALSADGKTLVSASDKEIAVWDLTKPEPVARTVDIGATSVALSADGRTLVSGSKDHKVRMWNLTRLEGKPRLLRVLNGHENSVTSIALSADGRIAVSGGEDGTVRVWDLPQPDAVLRGQNMALSADGHILVYSSGDDVLIQDLRKPDIEALVLGVHEGVVHNVAVSADGHTVASSSGKDETVRVWELNRPKAELRVLRGINVSSLSFSAGKQTLWLANNSSGNVMVWDLTKADTEPRVIGRHSDLCSVALSIDGHTLVSGGLNHEVYFWDLTQPEPVARKVGIGGPSVAVSADGQTVVFGSNEDKTVRVWDPSQPEVEAQVLGEYEGWVNSVAVSAKGQTVVSGNEDKTVLWDLTQPEVEAQVLGVHEGWVNSVAVSADGQTVVSGSDDERVQVWHRDLIEIEELIPRLCRWVGRNMTSNEWENYFPGSEYRATCPQWPVFN